MSDSTPMTPKEAQQWADMADDVPGYHDQPASRAYRTIASMTVEEEHRIVPADTNGGIYQTRRWTRHVTEWKPDE